MIDIPKIVVNNTKVDQKNLIFFVSDVDFMEKEML